MDQHLLAADVDANEAVGAVGFGGGLLGIDNAEDLDVLLLEGEAGEATGV